MSYQLELFDKSEQQIKDEIQYYFDYLQKPSDAFGGSEQLIYWNTGLRFSIN